MNRQITEAVERLFSACLEVTVHNRHHAFIKYSGAFDHVQVYVHPAGVDYTAIPHPEPILSEGIGLSPTKYHDPEEFSAACLRKINSLIDKLNGYLAAPEPIATDDPNIALEWLRAGRPIRISAESASDLSSQAKALAELESRQAA